MKIITILFSFAFAVHSLGGYSQEKVSREEKVKLIKLRNEIASDLTNNLLPFWMEHSVDQNDTNKGFYGAIANNGKGVADADKYNVLFTRYLWTWSAAYRILDNKKALNLAHRAYSYLNNFFWDKDNGGVYWTLNADGTVSDSTKMTYGQSFAIYSLSEYYRITGNKKSLEKAVELFRILEEHAADKEYGGYFEAFTADWKLLPEKGVAMGQAKSMNTHLHMLEAYTNLYRVWPDSHLKTKLYQIVSLFQNHILDKNTGHQELYFEPDWKVYGRFDSYGHDIEFSWLIVEAAKVLGDSELMDTIRKSTVHIAEVQLEEGMNEDGAMIYEKEGENHYNRNISWWVQSEAVVGFLNAYELSGDKKFLDAALNVWKYIQEHMIDETYGGWYPNLNENGLPVQNRLKGDGWTGPYHNVRMGLEVYERLHHME